MNLSIEKYFIGISVLVASLILLIFNQIEYFYIVGVLGLFTSMMFFLGHKSVESKYYKIGKVLLYIQVSLFFLISSIKTGLLGITIGILALAVLRWTLKIVENEDDDDELY